MRLFYYLIHSLIEVGTGWKLYIVGAGLITASVGNMPDGSVLGTAGVFALAVIYVIGGAK
ncbi:MAG: hypothetical protein COA84_13850 [Robiginitomaculum sp.]|nr:MAG: hypothetical protein COA84_13850 [Robiginitomaculum sp.]